MSEKIVKAIRKFYNSPGRKVHENILLNEIFSNEEIRKNIIEQIKDNMSLDYHVGRCELDIVNLNIEIQIKNNK